MKVQKIALAILLACSVSVSMAGTLFGSPVVAKPKPTPVQPAPTPVAPVGSIPSTCDYTVYQTGAVATPSTVKLNVSSQTLTFPGPKNWFPTIGSNGVFILKLVVPTNAAFTKPHVFEYAEYSAPGTSRLVYVSKTPCFTNAKLVQGSISGSVGVKGSTTVSGYSGGKLNVMAGDTWYLMIVNMSQDTKRGDPAFGLPTGTSCSNPAANNQCEMIVVFQ